MRLAVDIGNYTPTPTPEQVRCLLDAGYTTAIVGASFGTRAPAQLQAFRNGGMEIEAYAWVSFAEWYQAPLDVALQRIEGLPVRRLWLDCEEDTTLHPTAVLDRIRAAYMHVEHARPDLEIGIYTGAWWWADFVANATDFKDLPLWSAYYDNEPDIDFGKLPYGGWSAPAIEQYAGTVETCGLNTDRNVISEELEMADAPTKGEFQALARYTVEVAKDLATATFQLARQVYGDDDAKTWDLRQRVEELEARLAAHPPA